MFGYQTTSVHHTDALQSRQWRLHRKMTGPSAAESTRAAAVCTAPEFWVALWPPVVALWVKVVWVVVRKVWVLCSATGHGMPPSTSSVRQTGGM